MGWMTIDNQGRKRQMQDMFTYLLIHDYQIYGFMVYSRYINQGYPIALAESTFALIYDGADTFTCFLNVSQSVHIFNL